LESFDSDNIVEIEAADYVPDSADGNFDDEV